MNERTPRLLSLLRDHFEVHAIPPGRLGGLIYDQSLSKPARYVMFPIEMGSLFWRTLAAIRRDRCGLVFAEGTYFSFAGGLAARVAGKPFIWDNHGNIWDLAKSLSKSGIFLRSNQLLERLLARACARTIVVSEAERRTYVEHGYDAMKFEVLPTGVDVKEVGAKAAARQVARERLGLPDDQIVILFFGSLGYIPNRDAAAYIINELGPAVVRIDPRVRVYIAGGGGQGLQPGPGVELLGFVDDLQLWLSAADLCIAPLWKGVGILTKVLDMMAAQRPVVVTPLALEGIPELVDGVNCKLGKDREQFLDSVTALVGDARLRDRLGLEGAKLVARSYDWHDLGQRLSAILQKVMTEAEGGTASISIATEDANPRERK